MNEEQIYWAYLERLRRKLIGKYDELGLRAGSKYEKELEPEVEGNRLTMWGAYHSIFMEQGRSAGAMPPIAAIEEWIETKEGLPQHFIERKDQVKWAIAKKIANEGTSVPNKFNKGKVISEILDEFLVKDIYEMLDELGVIWTQRFQSDIVQLFKQAA